MIELLQISSTFLSICVNSNVCGLDNQIFISFNFTFSCFGMVPIFTDSGQNLNPFVQLLFSFSFLAFIYQTFLFSFQQVSFSYLDVLISVDLIIPEYFILIRSAYGFSWYHLFTMVELKSFAQFSISPYPVIPTF